MKRPLFAALLLAALVAGPLSAGPAVSVVLDDGSLVKGELLGLDKGVLVLLGADGKTQDIPQGRVKHVLGVDGQALSVGAAAAPSPVPSAAPAVTPAAGPPTQTSTVLIWAGGALTVVGGLYMIEAGSGPDADVAWSNGTAMGGVVVGGIGLVGLTLGLVLHYQHPADTGITATALLRYRDGRLTLGLPQVGLGPHGGERAVLARAEF
jgi:hypothetical protein